MFHALKTEICWACLENTVYFRVKISIWSKGHARDGDSILKGASGYDFFVRNSIHCGCSSFRVVHCTQSHSFSASVDLMKTLPGILYNYYWRLGQLSAWLGSGRKGWFGLDNMDTFPEVVTIFSWKGDYHCCSHPIVKVWALLVVKEWGISRLGVLFSIKGGKRRHFPVIARQWPVAVAWWEPLYSTSFCSYSAAWSHYRPSSSYFLMIMRNCTHPFLWPSPVWFL